MTNLAPIHKHPMVTDYRQSPHTKLVRAPASVRTRENEAAKDHSVACAAQCLFVIPFPYPLGDAVAIPCLSDG